MTLSNDSKQELLRTAQRLKQLAREQLASIDPSDAQAAAEAILDPAFGHVVDESELVWPGDLADDWEPVSD